jgi:hypothetical protein
MRLILVTVDATVGDYRWAAGLLWGEAGEFAVDEFDRINRDVFGCGGLPPLPIVIGITAYGHCTGLTRYRARPRISLASRLFANTLMVRDTLIHEMGHASLLLQRLTPDHNAAPWCHLVERLSPVVVGVAVRAQPARSVRVPNPARATDPDAPKTVVRKATPGGALTRGELAHWPHSIRPAGYYEGGREIPVDR